MIVVCDRCKERQVQYEQYFMFGWCEIETKEPGYRGEKLILCPSCYKDFKRFIGEMPAEEC